MQLHSIVVKRDLVFIGVIGTISPLLGIIILLSRQDALAFVLAIICISGISILFFGDIPETLELNKATNSMHFTRKSPLRKHTSTYNLQEITEINVIQKTKKSFVIVFLSSGAYIQLGRSKDIHDAQLLCAKIQSFLSERNDLS